MTDLLHAEILKIQALVQAGVGLMALVMIGVVWARTKAFVPTIGAVLFGAVVTWSVHNVDFLQQKVNDEFQSQSMPALVIRIPMASVDV
ncbi:MAG TPA: hypothetical protein VM143_14380 [Acidimicrobiales bacterium]|nr:hypothetical protein [Acidimicrobiales bacterium]